MGDAYLAARLRQAKYDGANGARPKKLLAHMLKIASSSDPEELEAAYNSFLKDLTLYEFSMGKIQIVADTNLREVAAYKEQQELLAQDMQRLSTEIESLKVKVAHERVVRKNKEEYAALAHQVEKHPPRSQTQKDQEALNEQLASLEEATVRHHQLMEKRKKQLALILHEVEHLKKTVLDTEEDLAALPQPSEGEASDSFGAQQGAGGGDVEMGETI